MNGRTPFIAAHHQQVWAKYKTKSNQSPERKGDTYKNPTFLPHVQVVDTNGRVGDGGLKPPLLSHATSFAN